MIPRSLGGTNDAVLPCDNGPWNDYEIVNCSGEPGLETGVRHKDDPDGRVFTVQDRLKLPNPLVEGPGVMKTKGAVIISDDGTVVPYKRRRR